MSLWNNLQSLVNLMLLSPHRGCGAYSRGALIRVNTVRGFGITRNEGCINAAVQDGGGVWIFGFSVFALKNAVFRFWCLTQFAGFLQFSLWFSVFVNNDGGFSDFSVQYILRFSGFAKEIATCSRAKTVIPMASYIQLYSILPFLSEEWMTSLICLAAVIWVVTAVKQTVKS